MFHQFPGGPEVKTAGGNGGGKARYKTAILEMFSLVMWHYEQVLSFFLSFIMFFHYHPSLSEHNLVFPFKLHTVILYIQYNISP